MRTKKQYKIKDTTSGLFWIGYGSGFNESGTTYASYELAGRSLANQIGLRHQSLIPFLPHLSIVEYEVVIEEKTSYVAQECMFAYRFSLKLGEKHGYRFQNAHRKMKNLEKENPEKIFRYAIKINHTDFTEFRESLKGLGFSSRNYRKVDEWLFTDNPDVVARTKLLSFAETTIDLEAERQDFSRQETYYKEAE